MCFTSTTDRSWAKKNMTSKNSSGAKIVAMPRRLSPEASRQVALEAARELLIEAGPQAVTLKAVSHRIGRTHANLLHHFGSASGLQRDLSGYLAEKVCSAIAGEINLVRDGKASARDLADMIFDAFDREGAGALASWMLLSGNEDALNPVVEAIHNLVDQISETGHGDSGLHILTLELVLLALGDTLMGAQLSSSLGLPRETARESAARMLTERADWVRSSETQCSIGEAVDPQ